MEAIQQRMQTANTAFQAIQAELQRAVDTRQTLASQLTENEAVQKEFKALPADSQIYKQMGPGLVKQDQVEAKANVEKRLEFIKGEIKRCETQIKELNEKGEKRKNELVGLQMEAQRLQMGTESEDPAAAAEA